jgi:hypothetical protein
VNSISNPSNYNNISKLQDFITHRNKIKSEVFQKQVSLKKLKLDIEKKLSDIYLPIKDSGEKLELKETFRLNDHQVERLRDNIMELSRQLKTSEADYISSLNQLNELESEILILSAQDSDINTIQNDQTSINLQTPHTIKTPLHYTPTSTARTSHWKVEGGVTLLDVLSGRADIYRENKESAAGFSSRLHRRLAHLRYLEAQQQQALEEKATLVRAMRDQVIRVLCTSMYYVVCMYFIFTYF